MNVLQANQNLFADGRVIFAQRGRQKFLSWQDLAK
jgi:hypothetical protein